MNPMYVSLNPPSTSFFTLYRFLCDLVAIPFFLSVTVLSKIRSQYIANAISTTITKHTHKHKTLTKLILYRFQSTSILFILDFPSIFTSILILSNVFILSIGFIECDSFGRHFWFCDGLFSFFMISTLSVPLYVLSRKNISQVSATSCK